MKKILGILVLCNSLICINARPTDQEDTEDWENQLSDNESERVGFGKLYNDPQIKNASVRRTTCGNSSDLNNPEATFAESKQMNNLVQNELKRESSLDFSDFIATAEGGLPSGYSAEAGLDGIMAGGRPSLEYPSTACAYDSASAHSTEHSPRATAAPHSGLLNNETTPNGIDISTIELPMPIEMTNAGDLHSQGMPSTLQKNKSITLPVKIDKEGQPDLMIDASNPSIIAQGHGGMNPPPNGRRKAVIVVTAISGLVIISIIAGKIIINKLAEWRDKMTDSENDNPDEKWERERWLEAMNG